VFFVDLRGKKLEDALRGLRRWREEGRRVMKVMKSDEE
jgi:hypothetical protein